MASKRCEHNLVLCSRCVVVTDAARRMRDAVCLATVFHSFEEIQHGWMAFALADGSTDHVLYPSKREAIAHQSNEFLYAYLCLRNCIAGMPVKDAQLWLDLHRHAYENNFRLADPDAPDMIMPVARPWQN